MASSPAIHHLALNWNGCLAHYRAHRHAEHLEALFDEAVRFAGMQLEGDLSRSDYWSTVPLRRRAAVLLFLVDRGVVFRHRDENGAVTFEIHPAAETWVATQPTLAAYVHPTYELLCALRNNQAMRLLRSSLA